MGAASVGGIWGKWPCKDRRERKKDPRTESAQEKGEGKKANREQGERGGNNTAPLTALQWRKLPGTPLWGRGNYQELTGGKC